MRVKSNFGFGKLCLAKKNVSITRTKGDDPGRHGLVRPQRPSFSANLLQNLGLVNQLCRVGRLDEETPQFIKSCPHL